MSDLQLEKETAAYKKADIDFQYEIIRTGKESVPRFTRVEDGYWRKIAPGEDGKVVLFCGGDLMCEPTMSEACCFANGYDFRICFKRIRPLLRECDLAVANLETIVSKRIPYAHEKHRVDHHTGVRYHCNAPEDYVDALRYAGFDALVLANNHDADGGYEGIIDTIDSVEAREIMTTGMFRNEKESRVLLVEINGIRLAILSYTEHINRKLDTEILTEEGCRVMLNRYSQERVREDVAEAKRRGAEFILVYIHFLGKDYSHEVWNRQRRAAKEIADAGADCIMGSHMHCIQEYDVLLSEDGRRVPVVYSLGNLVTSDRTGSMTRRSIIYRLQLKRTDEGAVVIDRESYIPCRTVEGFKKSSFIVFPSWDRKRRKIGRQSKIQQIIAEEIGPKIRREGDA